jgi:carboxymethylenebutenolidase
MRRLDVQIPAPDGRSNGTLHVPDGNGPWPGVLVFPDGAERGRRSGRWATGWRAWVMSH